LVGGARIKHLSRGLNDALGRGFASVHASLGRSKSRVLHAGEKKDAVPNRWPRHRFDDGLGFEVYAHGGVFAGTRVDRGTQLLLSALEKWRAPSEGPLLDLGCGSGILARWLIDHYPQRSIWASDVSAAAVASARQTLAGTTVQVERRDGLSGLESSSVGAIVSNPPFHVGAAKDSGPTIEMIKDASRVLRTGGELIMVYNSHLPYLQRLQRIGATKIIARDRNYLVTRSVKGRSAGR
jgi:16S rRNA (guanine1207-N2)-methyltransferase